MDRTKYEQLVSFIRRFILFFNPSTYTRHLKRLPKRHAISPTQLILPIWKKSLLNPNWIEFVDGFDAISIKCVEGDTLYGMKDARELASQIKSAGLELHGWGFHYCTSEGSARAEAKAAARACNDLRLKAYHWNAEKHWDKAPGSALNGKVFAQEFRAGAPGVFLFANCFNEPTTTDMIVFFDAFEPMCYGTKASTISTKINNRMGRDLPDSKKAIMVGTGRMNKASQGQSWGYFETGSNDVPGLLELAVKHRPLAINFFRAGVADGEDIMVAPNKNNPALSEQAKKLRQALNQVVAT